MFAILKSVLLICSISILCLSSIGAQSTDNPPSGQEDLDAYIRKKHGLDQELINDIQFYNRYHGVMKHPYLKGLEPLPGSVILSGKKYDNLMAKYDLYAQCLILTYQGMLGGINQIFLSSVRIDAFDLSGNYFEKLDLDNRGLLFYQVIREEGLACYIHWDKQKMETTDNLQYPEVFTDPRHHCYLELDGELHPFTSKRKLVSLFSPGTKKEIKKYVWQHNIRLLRASPEQLTGLMEFISSVLPSSSQN